MQPQQHQIEFLVRGRYALFADPITRTGGEKSTYPLPTYQALKGILESVYWRPTIIWIIDSVRVMSPIRVEAKHIRPINFSAPGNTLSIYTYLSAPVYQVRAHFIWNMNRPEFKKDRDEKKHLHIARRMIERGGRRDVFLGTRECQGYVEPCVFGEGTGYYDDTGHIDFGLMFHGFNYPDEIGESILAARFWRPSMENGVVIFPSPEACDRRLCRIIRPSKKKDFPPSVCQDNPALQSLLMEVEADGLDAGAM